MKSYTYDERGVKVDSMPVAAEDTVSGAKLYYFTRGPQKFELMSFVTPYGVGLDLGKTGTIWEFDVTDYLTVMKGWKRLTMERGAGQEEFDLRFLFIKGTPARPVLDMQQIWPMTEEAYQTIQSDDRYEPRIVHLNPAARGYKLRSYITGHGQDPTNRGLNGEFTAQTHYLSVNNTKYERLVWKECSSDPLYPQGGTWPLNRAGWCPGMATDLAEYEITGTVTPGDDVTIDYGVEGGVGDSRYDPSTQLMTYGAPNFTHDAAIVAIQRPSSHIEYGRINPACDQPIVVIRNNGSSPLTSLRFEYYADNGPHQTYAWTGNLNFLDTLAVVLPVDSVSFWTSDTSGTFHVDISQPNGLVDEYARNNHYESHFTQPPTYAGIVVVNLVTNKNPAENYYEVLDHAGNTVFSNNNFAAFKSYYDSLMLPNGCYTLIMHDDGEDGLSVWFNPNAGNGSLKLRQTAKNGKILKNFNPDFGKFTQFDFSIANSTFAVSNPDIVLCRVLLYPNPAQGFLHVDLEGYPSEMIMLEIIDEAGAVLRREQRATGSIGSMDAVLNTSALARGSYVLRITTRDAETEKSFVVE